MAENNSGLDDIVSKLVGDLISSIDSQLKQAIEDNAGLEGEFRCYVDHKKSRWYYIGDEPILFTEDPRFIHKGTTLTLECKTSTNKEFLHKNNPFIKLSHTTDP